MNRSLALLGVLLLAPFAALSSGAQAPWHVDDRTGDQAFTSTQGIGSPGTMSSHLDIDRVELLREDEIALTFVIKVASLVTGPSYGFWKDCSYFGDRSSFVFGIAEETIRFSFSLADVAYDARVDLVGVWDPLRGLFVARDAGGCLCPEAAIANSWCRGQPFPVLLDDARDEITIRLTKAALIGKATTGSPSFGQTVSAYPERLRAGDKLTGLAFETRSYPFGLQVSTVASNEVRDRAPDAGSAPDYTLVTGLANDPVSARLEGGAELAVQAGANQSVAFTVTNRDAGKRILSWQYLLEGRADVLHRYAVSGPATTSVAGGESRTFHLALDVREGAVANDNVTLSIRGTSAGYQGEVAYAYVLLKPAEPLTPSQNVLYLHSLQHEASPLQSSCGTGPRTTCTSGYWTARADDPTADDVDLLIPYQPGYSNRFSSGWQAGTIRARGGSPTPLLFDPQGRIEVALATRLPNELPDVTVTLSLKVDNGTNAPTVATTGREVTFPAGDGVTKFSMTFKPKEKLVPRGAQLLLEMRFEGPADAGAAQAYARDGGILLRPRETQIRLPLLELPEGLLSRLVESPFQFTLQGDRDDFVNPGESRAFNLTLLNQDTRTHTARLSGSTAEAGWGIRFLPAAEYVLKPGETLRVAALVTAPADAKENVPVPVHFNVTDPEGRALGVQVVLVATATVDLADDALRVRPDADAEAAAVKPPARTSPAFALPLVILALPWLRRRR